MPSIYLNLTPTQVDRIQAPTEGEAFYRDADLTGFGLRVTSKGTKSFFVNARVKRAGTTRRKALGKFPAVTVDEAKARAMVYLSNFSQGKDPVSDGKIIRSDDHNPTVKRVLDDYLRTKTLKPSTEADYRKVLKWGIDDWMRYDLVNIDRDMIQRRHSELGERSKAQANYLMRVLRALFNYAMEAYRGPRGKQIIEDNPVLFLSRLKRWHRVQRKRTVIKAAELPAWFKAVNGLKGERKGERAEIARDYLKFLLFTGGRKTEAATLTRSHIDLQAKTFTFTNTKNWNEHALPMSEPVFEILTRRMDTGDEWVFPGSNDHHINDCRYWVGVVKEQSEVQFTLHDLRRTFTTVAESLDLSAYTLKRLLNHKTESDVTSGYIVSDVERLRDPMNRIAVRLKELSNV